MLGFQAVGLPWDHRFVLTFWSLLLVESQIKNLSGFNSGQCSLNLQPAL